MWENLRTSSPSTLITTLNCGITSSFPPSPPPPAGAGAGAGAKATALGGRALAWA